MSSLKCAYGDTVRQFSTTATGTNEDYHTEGAQVRLATLWMTRFSSRIPERQSRPQLEPPSALAARFMANSPSCRGAYLDNPQV